MGLFDGMGFGSGYNNSWSRKAMRRDYIDSDYPRIPRDPNEPLYSFVGLIIGLAMGLAGVVYMHMPSHPQKDRQISQENLVSITNDYDRALQEHYQMIKEHNKTIEDYRGQITERRDK